MTFDEELTAMANDIINLSVEDEQKGLEVLQVYLRDIAADPRASAFLLSFLRSLGAALMTEEAQETMALAKLLFRRLAYLGPIAGAKVYPPDEDFEQVADEMPFQRSCSGCSGECDCGGKE